MYCSLQVPIKGSFVMQTNKGHAGTTVLGIPQHLAQRFKFPRTSPFTRAQFSVPAGKKPVNISADVPMQRWLLGQLHSTSGRMLHTVLCMLCRYAGALRDELLRYRKETKAFLRGSSPATQLSVHIIASTVRVESSTPHDVGYPSALG